MTEREVLTVRNYYEPSGRRWTFGIKFALVKGRYEPVNIELHSQGSAISATALRKLPLGEILTEARRAHRKLADGGIARARTAESKRKAKEHAARFGPQRGVQLSHDELVKVAEVYRKAYHDGRVTAAVAEACGVSASTAGKRIMAARAAGLLDGIGGRK